jgi:hypothetical protein
MTKHHAKVFGGAAFCFIALGTAILSCTLNVQFGLATGISAAVVLFLAEIARITIPVVATNHGWHPMLKVAIVLCGITSLYAATSQWLDQDAGHLLAVKTTNATSDRATAEYTRISSQLAGLKVTGTVADLEALAKTYKDKATAEAGRGLCGKLCIKAEADYAATLAALAPARQKEKLEAELVTAKAELAQAKPVAVSGTATFIGAVTGLDVDKITVGLGFFKAGITIGLTEVLVYLIILGFPMFLSGYRGLKGIEEPVEALVETSVAVLKPLAGRKDETLQRLLSMCLRNQDGCIITSDRQLSKQLGIANSTLNLWLKDWAKEGRITVEPVTAHKKRYSAA